MPKRLVVLLRVLAVLACVPLGCRSSRPPAVTPEMRRVIQQTVRETLDEELERSLGRARIDSSVLRRADARSALHLLRRKQANSDALMTAAIRIASDAQTWKRKPSQFGGADDQDDFDGFTFAKISYPAEAGVREAF